MASLQHLPRPSPACRHEGTRPAFGRWDQATTKNFRKGDRVRQMAVDPSVKE